MKKVHQSPEFQIIVQDQANAKFFVASFTPQDATTNPPMTTAPTGVTGITSSSASSYGQDQQGFNF